MDTPGVLGGLRRALSALLGGKAVQDNLPSQQDVAAASPDAAVVEPRGRRAKLRRQKEEEDRVKFLGAVADKKFQVVLLKESRDMYEGRPGVDYKLPSHHKKLEPRDSSQSAQIVKFGLDISEQNMGPKNRRYMPKPIATLEHMLTDEELRIEEAKRDLPAGRHHQYRGHEKLFAVKGNQATAEAIFGKLHPPVYEEDRLLPDPDIAKKANADLVKKEARMWAPIKRIKKAALDLSRRPVRLAPKGGGVGVVVEGLDQPSFTQDSASIATDDRSFLSVPFADFPMSDAQQEDRWKYMNDGVDSEAGARSLFSENSIGRSMTLITLKFTRLRGIRGLEGKKVKGIALESLNSQVTRGRERQVIKKFNVRLKEAIARASKAGSLTQSKYPADGLIQNLYIQ
jgi:hypothetical protein